MAKKVTHDDTDKLFEHGLDLKNRLVYMGSVDRLGDDDEEDGSSCDFRMAEKLIKALHLLEANGTGDITIIMNNGGGSEYHGMAIYDAIRGCKSKVTIKVYGLAMSMGSLILQAADERIMAPHARFMIHYGSWGTSDHPKITYKHVEEGKRWDVIMEDIYIEKMLEKDDEMSAEGEVNYIGRQVSEFIHKYNKMTSLNPKRKVRFKLPADPIKRRAKLREAVQELLNFDCYMTPEETVALGLADKMDY